LDVLNLSDAFSFNEDDLAQAISFLQLSPQLGKQFEETVETSSSEAKDLDAAGIFESPVVDTPHTNADSMDSCFSSNLSFEDSIFLKDNFLSPKHPTRSLSNYIFSPLRFRGLFNSLPETTQIDEDSDIGKTITEDTMLIMEMNDRSDEGTNTENKNKKNEERTQIESWNQITRDFTSAIETMTEVGETWNEATLPYLPYSVKMQEEEKEGEKDLAKADKYFSKVGTPSACGTGSLKQAKRLTYDSTSCIQTPSKIAAPTPSKSTYLSSPAMHLSPTSLFLSSPVPSHISSNRIRHAAPLPLKHHLLRGLESPYHFPMHSSEQVERSSKAPATQLAPGSGLTAPRSAKTVMARPGTARKAYGHTGIVRNVTPSRNGKNSKENVITDRVTPLQKSSQTTVTSKMVTPSSTHYALKNNANLNNKNN